MTVSDPPSPPTTIDKMLVDPAVPLPIRRQLLHQLCNEDTKQSAELLRSILAKLAANGAQEHYVELCKQVQGLLEQMMAGPLREGTFVCMLSSNGHGPRALVLLSDGTPHFCIVPEESLVRELRRGDTVWLEPQGRAVLFRDSEPKQVGEEARLERRIDGQFIEVSLREQQRFVYRASEHLVDQIDRGEAEPGDTIIVSPSREMGYMRVPKADGLAHFKFLAREPVPDVVVERDLGSPPPFIDKLLEHVTSEMEEPELNRRYGQTRFRSVLLAGVSGAGKTFAIQAFWNAMYSEISRITGVSVGEIPPRVVRVRASQVLSMWLGESDKAIDRVFDEVEELATQKLVGPDGTEHEVPLLLIIEEIDGLGRSRGADSDGVHDRILTTFLQRFDPTRREIGSRFIIAISTTNCLAQIDQALHKRIATMGLELFGRLDRKSFVAVLEKHLRNRPVQTNAGEDEERARRRLTSEITSWLFSPNGEALGQFEVTYAGSTTPNVKHRRDLLTAGLVDRSVQEACARACRAERLGCDRPGVTRSLLVDAFDRHVRAIVDRLQPQNVADYITIPDGVRVMTVRRIEQPSVLPVELERLPRAG